MGDGTNQSPYTREDVLRLIEQNGGKAEGLNLSGKVFEKGIDLRGLNNNHLQGVTLNNARFPQSLRRGAPLRGANLKGVHLEGAHLREAHLEEADLSDTYLESANLGYTHLEGANLSGAHLGSAHLGRAHLQGAILQDTEFSDDTGLENVDWGNYILGDESMGFDVAVDTYRRLKQWYTNVGMYDIAGNFFYREKEAIRKQTQGEFTAQLRSKTIWSLFWSRRTLTWSFLWLSIYRLLCGYGEKTLRIVGWAALVILTLASAYFVIGSVWEWSAFWKSLYFSAVSFTALGYGSWVNETWIDINNNLIIGIGVSESFLGVFMMALFIVTFTRKMTR